MIIYFFLKLATTLSLIQDVFSVLRDPKDLSRHIDVQYYLSGDDLSGIQKQSLTSVEFIGCDQGHHLVRELSFVVRIVIHLRRIIFWLMDQLYISSKGNFRGNFISCCWASHTQCPLLC